ncbi:MAG: hypothetical protein GF346_03345 [Candidatus Eisenbacteria bacterium]|nr:hypothetical protein [Candidatus Latescibacterota bacterium]MBD3301457.1 hypothetical protein [Candidatus Eisenbacteria bacterium]
MDRRGKFKKLKQDPFERKRKAREQLERSDPKRKNWMDYLEEDEEDEELDGEVLEEEGQERDQEGEGEEDSR